MSRLGDEVARMRLAKGLSQKQLARQAGVAESYIQDVESGKRVMNDQLATRISKILGGHFGTEAPETAEPSEPIRSRPPVRPGMPSRTAAPARSAGQLVYSSAPEEQEKSTAGAGASVWSEAFGQMLKEVPVYAPDMRTQTGTRTMAVVAGKVEGQPKEKVFWLAAEDNDMIGYRIQRTDTVFCVQAAAMSGDGFYFVEWGGRRAMRHLKAMPGGMVQVSCHKGAPVRETLSGSLVQVLGKLLRVEIVLP